MKTTTMNVENLYRSLRAPLMGFIRRRVADDQAVEDILHDVFFKIHTRIEGLREQDKVETWIYQITRNAIVDYYRKPNHSANLPETVPALETGEEDDAVQRISPGLKAMINRMPPHYRDALLLTDYEGLTQRELAARLNISLSGAKSRVQRARQLLKDMLMNCCHFEFDMYGTILDYHPIECCCCSNAHKGG